MKIIIGADHRGFNLKYRLLKWFVENSWDYEDVGALSYDEHDDYPIYASRVAHKITEDPSFCGIVICGSGVGVCVTSNKIIGVRCGQAINVDQVVEMRKHDNVNVLSLASDYMGFEMAKQMIVAFLNTEFEAQDRHVRRLEMIQKLENDNNVGNETVC